MCNLISSGQARWELPAAGTRIQTIDLHTEGEPLRVILGGFPAVQGASILEYRRHARQQFDQLRTALMWEPRGHADMYGCLLTPPVSEAAAFGLLFLHNEGYSTMCGHAVIAIATLATQMGWVPVTEPLTRLLLDTPAGKVAAFARVEAGQVQRAGFENVPSFVVATHRRVAVPGLGEVEYDLAFGGAYYAYVEAAAIGLSLEAASFRQLIEAGMAIKRAVMGQNPPLRHPEAAELDFLYGTIFTGPPQDADAHSRHVCVFAEGEVDRSPTGTGVSGRLALLDHYGEARGGENLVFESIIGSRFEGRVMRRTTFGEYAAIIPEVSGRAFITGRHEFYLDPYDPLQHGFILR